MNAPSTPVPGLVNGGPDLPREYGVTRLVLMPRDPQWMHAYWEVAPYTWQEVERNFGPEVRSLGRATLRLYSSESKRTFDVGVELESRNWYIFSPIRGGSWHAELGLTLPDGRFVLLAVSNQVQMPGGQVSDVIDEKWGIIKAELERLFELSGGGRLGAGSLDIAKMAAQRWELLKAMSSWAGSPAGSPWSQPAGQPKGFWLVADCELVVYGATDPTARVRVQGQAIPLNPDGTFSLRFALPEGEIKIPIEATHSDGDMVKSVEFHVTRGTQKSA
jgi:hypothetical protein